MGMNDKGRHANVTGQHLAFSGTGGNTIGEISGNNSASKTRARLARAEWDDWKERFKPIRERLHESINNERQLADQIDRAEDSFETGFDTSQDTFERQRERRGLNMTDEQQKVHERKTSLNKTKGLIGAKNNARRRSERRDLRNMAGGG